MMCKSCQTILLVISETIIDQQIQSQRNVKFLIVYPFLKSEDGSIVYIEFALSIL